MPSEKITQSPVPNRLPAAPPRPAVAPLTSPATSGSVDFPTAIAAIVSGRTVTRAEWEEVCPCKLRDGFLMLQRGGEWHTWIVSEVDMKATDWTVVE